MKLNREQEFERQLRELESLLPKCMLADRIRLGRQLARARRSGGRKGRRQQDPGAELARLRRQAETSSSLRERRARLAPSIQYPEELPISAARGEILQAIREHPVVVVAGDTGSGKTTQIPKICLEAGRGREARIACTQPRRVAALSLSRRLADELGVTWGREVGCKIRFRDRTTPETLVKMVTDGMLLAEIRGDPDLLEYDTVILDEAHERSLNIDFLLGYLRLLQQRRPDLKIVITSATIDTAKFSAAFDGAPIIEVSGRVYPVEVRYWPLEELLGDGDDFSYVDAAVCAVEKLAQESTTGDILLFMPGERDIRETRDRLEGRLAGAEVVPLFGRLTSAEQQRVFAPGPKRRVVVATNIAETSLTIPRIRCVVDSGLARLNRFNPSTQTQRLPIEAISRSSCDQRKGRCGRVQDGICVRLYSEEDFLARPEHTQPEIQRADLAEVVLRMLELNLGDVHAFPFIDPPQPRAIEAGYRLLGELGAIDKERRLTALGRDMVRMATAPTVSRMVIQAREEDALPEVLIIAAGISIRDPRERPEELATEADRQHRQFADPRSDFLSLLNIWNTYHDRFEELKTQNQMRKFCRQHFLSFSRMREWRDIHAQLSGAASGLENFRQREPDRQPAGYDAIHRAILSGLMGNVACKKERNLYRAARGREVMLFPGSGLFQRKAVPPARRASAPADRDKDSDGVAEKGGTPGWILAAEIVETSRLFARTAAAIQATWLLDLGEHICRSSYRDPHWSKRAGRVLVHETVRLHGLEIVTRKVAYRRVDPKEATEIFIREALVPGELHTPHPFLEHNQRLGERIETWQTRLRQRQGIDIDQVAFEFYAGKELEDISSIHDLNRLIRQRPDGDRFLFMAEADLLGDLNANVDLKDFPDAIVVDGEEVAIDYAYRPGQDDDGITAKLPYRLVDAIDPEVLEWLVPGLRQEKVVCLLRSLPKALRKQLIPVAETARQIAVALTPSHDTFLESLEVFLLEHYGLKVRRTDWDRAAVPDYLRMRIDIQGTGGQSLAAGRNLSELAEKLARHDTPVETDAWKRAAAQWRRDGLTDWKGQPDLPERIEVTSVSGVPLFGYPGLQTENGEVGVRLFRSGKEAKSASLGGLMRLHELSLKQDLARLRRQLEGLRELADLCQSLGGPAELQEEAYAHLLQYLFEGDALLPVTGEGIAARQQQASTRLGGLADRFVSLVRELLQIRREIIACSWPYDGIAADLQRLLPRHFLLHLPFQRLPHLCRYLKAMLVRAERARADSGRDASKAELVRPYQEAVARLLAPSEETDSSGATNLQEFRWMVEEFRVSVFAQELGTAQPVSPKRLNRKLDEVESM